MSSRILVAAAAAAAVLVGAAGAQANWPDRPISLIVAYSAGGGTDVLARTVAPFLEKHIGGGARIAVVNRPGAGGEIGFTAIATARPDGYTIGMLNVPSVVNPLIERSPEYTLDDFAPIANLVSDPASIVVSSRSPFESLKDWAAYVEANPNVITVGNSSLGGASHTALLRFLTLADLKVTHVPFPGAAPSRTALMGGHIASSVMGLGEAGPLHKEGMLRVLATMAPERWEFVSDVPTFRELGYDVVAGSYRGLAAPAGVPDEILDRLAEAVRLTVEDPEFREQAEKQVLPLEYIPRAEYRALIAEVHQDMKAVWEANPWRR